MVGLGETYLPAFALAVGLGELTAGFVASLPQLAGGIMQLISPRAIAKLGSHRRWIVLCASIQALSFLPLVAAALYGWISAAGVLLIATIYWSTALATGPAWNTWIGSIVPRTLRARYFSCRTRLSQAAVLAGFLAGGIALQYGAAAGIPLKAFALLFFAAGAFRLVSAWFLSRQSEPEPMPRNMRRIPPAELFDRLRRGGEGRLLWYLALVQGAAYFAGPYFAPFMIRELRLTYGQFVWLIATAFVAKVVSLPLFGRLAARCGARQLLWIGGVGIAPVSAMWLVSNHMAWLTFVQLAAGATWAAYELAVLLCYFESVAAEERTSMLTAFNLATTAAMVVGSLLGGAVLTFLGPDPSTYYLLFALSTVFRFGTLLVLRTVPEIIVAPKPVTMRTIGVDPTSGSISRPILQDMPTPEAGATANTTSVVVEPLMLDATEAATAKIDFDEQFSTRKSA